MSAGAAVLTDSIYWTVIFPFLSLQDYEMGFVSSAPFPPELCICHFLCCIRSCTILQLPSELIINFSTANCVFSDDCEFAYEQPLFAGL